MKKTILLSFALLLTTVLFAQKKAVKSGAATTGSSSSASTAATGGLSACYIGKTWKLVKIEKFGVENAPGEEQKNDMLLLNSDGTFKVILKGIEKSGTFTRSGSWLNLKPLCGGEAIPYKIESCEGNTLKADWRDGDTHNHFTFTAQ